MSLRTVTPNQPVADFELAGTGGRLFRLSEHRGKNLVIYFYPKDNTPGCAGEAQQFRDLYALFRESGAEVIGISRDSLKSHENFKAKYSLPFDLLCDDREIACTLFAVIRMKKLYGKQVRRIERSTFVIDSNGVACREWRGVRVDGHAQEVLEFVKTL